MIVYAIAKNEARFAARWMKSVREADGVYVLDTGSEDGTAALLRSLGASVTEETVTPWRFDTARNRALALVPEDADICVSVDLDEVPLLGWRSALERSWKPGTTSARCRIAWGDGKGFEYYALRAHSRRGWRWVHPVHEVPTPLEDAAKGGCVTAEGVELRHCPDGEKSRAQYLPLLELAAAEEPENDRAAHYLGREYMYYARWDDCIRELKRHLALPSAQWREERCASMRFIGRAYAAKGERREAREWLFRAVAEASWLREPYIDMARLLYAEEDWEGIAWCTGEAVKITARGENYICEADCWGALPHDLRSIALWHLGNTASAADEAEKALALAPEDERIRNNLRFFRAQT